MFHRSARILFVLLALGTVHTLPVSAQSTGGQEQVAPQNHAEWVKVFEDQITRALRRSDTALNMTAHRPRGSAAVAITVTPQGQVADVQIIESRGRAMDAAYIRAFSGMKLPPFTADMSQVPFTTTINLTSSRG